MLGAVTFEFPSALNNASLLAKTPIILSSQNFTKLVLLFVGILGISKSLNLLILYLDLFVGTENL